MNTNFELRRGLKGNIARWVEEYRNDRRNMRKDREVLHIFKAIRGRHYCTVGDLGKVFMWKSDGRNLRFCRDDQDGFVEAATGVAFSADTSDERLRISVLTLLDGVQWPTASAMLHLYFLTDRPGKGYPVLDRRAMWSVSAIEVDEEPKYDYKFWREYVQFCRDTSTEEGVTMRDLDRALWKYSEKNQGKKGAG